MTDLTIIVPVFNEEGAIASALDAIASMRKQGVEIIVVDGGSSDRSVELARPRADTIITSERGRAAQMNAGAAAANGRILLFLHADTRLPPQADRLITDGLARSGRPWGRFDVRIEGRHPLLAIVARMMNLRSRLTGIATGDQAMFVTRETFHAVGGFPELPLMEDIALSVRLKRIARPLCLRQQVITSGRRWEKHGVLRTIALMWRLRLSYALGADPEALAVRYGYATRKTSNT